MTVQCFLVVPTGRSQVALRRFWRGSCVGPSERQQQYHDAEHIIGSYDSLQEPPPSPPLADPRWPRSCGRCGSVVPDGAEIDIRCSPLYRDGPTAEEPNTESGVTGTTLRQLQRPGAMWVMPWLHTPGSPQVSTYLSEHYRRDWSNIRPPIQVVCPNGAEWCVDSGSSNGSGWVVTGTPPLISCEPSIMAHAVADRVAYHGYLRGGVFTGASWTK